jgi:purine-binding chemotaxis protein CheW
MINETNEVGPGELSARLQPPPLAPSTDDTGTVQVLGFRLGEQSYGLEVAHVYEVSRMVAVTALPDSPPEVLGVVDYRGTIVPIIDLRTRFGLEERAVTLSTPIIIAWGGQRAIGLVVDEVSGVLAVEPGVIMEPDEFGQAGRCVSGVARLEDGLLLIVNPADLLSEEAARALTSSV